MSDEPALPEVYARIIAAVGAQDVEALEELLDAEIVDHNPVPDQPPGREGVVMWMRGMHAAFPDMTGAVEDTVAQGDKVAGRVVWSGTHHGEFLGVPGTGRRVSIVALHLLRFRNGKAAEWWGAADLLGAATSVGARVVPPARTGDPGVPGPAVLPRADGAGR